ncbi:MAG TPA: ATP-binding protein [Methanocorpusculum sp.]|nr:ATP-binding protein [Methanocorpusculum sp.]
MIPRERYIRKIRPFINKPIVKVLTGIRRCGKSAMLTLIADELVKQNIPQSSIIRINLEEHQYAKITTAEALVSCITAAIEKNGPQDADKYYLLIDEIQEVSGWEKAVNGFLAAEHYDIYITGSNSRLLSSELATYLAGRYVEIPIQTLTLSEALSFAEFRTGDSQNPKEAIISYLHTGGFPLLHTAEFDADAIKMIVNGIYSSVILRDVIQRYNLRSTDIFERLVLFLFENVGNIFSAKSVSDFLKSESRSLSQNTIYEYLSMLEEAFVIRKVRRYDLRGKRILKTLEKYYVSDISLITAVLGFKDTKISGMLENIVYLELLSRDYQVYIGKSGESEIDFIAEKSGERIYVQVARAIESDETRIREFSPLLAAADQYPKYVVTMDEFACGNIDGVKHVHLADFLLADTY